MRLVLDTNVVVSGLLWSGAPGHLLQAGLTGEVQLFTSTPLLAELTDILSRTKFERKITASQLSINEIVDLYAQLADSSDPVGCPGHWEGDLIIGKGNLSQIGTLWSSEVPSLSPLVNDCLTAGQTP